MGFWDNGPGGGLVLAPLFIRYLGLSVREVPFYSNCVMVVGSLVGALTFGMMETPGYRENFATFSGGS